MVKRKNGDEVVEEDESQRDKAQWHTRNVDLFCNLCIEQIELRNVKDGTFTKSGWTAISRWFKEETGMELIHKQFGNKWDCLKVDYKLWKDLKKECSEFGWDTKRNTVIATKEWWKEKLQVTPKAKKFMSSGIDSKLEHKLERMFRAIVTDNKEVGAPSSNMLLTCTSSQSNGTSDERIHFGSSLPSQSNGTSEERIHFCNTIPSYSTGTSDDRIQFGSNIPSHSNDTSDERIPCGIPSHSNGTSEERISCGIPSQSIGTSDKRIPFGILSESNFTSNAPIHFGRTVSSRSNGTSDERIPSGIQSQSNGKSDERMPSQLNDASDYNIMPGSSIRDVITLLDTMTEVQRGGQLYIFAVRKLFMIEPKREVFAVLLPDIRLQWLKE